MRIVMLFFYPLLILFGVTFAALNAQMVLVNLYFTTISLPVSVLMALMLGFGMIFGVILFAFRYWRLKVKYRRVQNKLKQFENKLRDIEPTVSKL